MPIKDSDVTLVKRDQVRHGITKEKQMKTGYHLCSASQISIFVLFFIKGKAKIEQKTSVLEIIIII